MGLNDPFLVKYSRFLKNAVHGDLGTSYFFKRPALEVILDKLVATLSWCLPPRSSSSGLHSAGVYSAIRPRSFLTKAHHGGEQHRHLDPGLPDRHHADVPLSIQLAGCRPMARGEDHNLLGWGVGILYLGRYPAPGAACCLLSSIMLPLFIRLVRSEMLEQLSSEYVKFARAKGLDNNKVYYQHALKNTMLPVITVGGVQIGTMVAYTILTESVFQWPGTGFLFLRRSTGSIRR